jgi:hypothetical protein
LCPPDDRFEVDDELELLARLAIAQLAEKEREKTHAVLTVSPNIRNN